MTFGTAQGQYVKRHYEKYARSVYTARTVHNIIVMDVLNVRDSVRWMDACGAGERVHVSVCTRKTFCGTRGMCGKFAFHRTTPPSIPYVYRYSWGEKNGKN
jgi:hypothetical protein